MDVSSTAGPGPQTAPGAAAACAVCTARQSRRLFTTRGYDVRGCEACGHRFADLAPADDHVARVYDETYFRGGGAGYADYLTEGTLLRARGRRYARILARHTAPGDLLDVGAAAGFVLQGFVDAGWRGAGIEPNATMAEHARTRLGLAVEATTIESFRTTRRFDVVSMIQVLPHLVDPAAALAAAAALTRPHGLWLVETWNRESWTARAFGRRWHEYSPPSVLHWFTPGGLARLVGRFGFVEVARGRLAKWIDGAHVRSLLAHSLDGVPGGRLARAGLRLIPAHLALPYPAEDLFWALYRRR